MEWNVLNSYFKGMHLQRLVRHQIESYNEWVTVELSRTIEMFNPISVASEQYFNRDAKQHSLDMQLRFENLRLMRPQIHENNGAIKVMFPHEARKRNFSYTASATVDIVITYTVRKGADLSEVETIRHTLPQIFIGKIPVMVRSSLCVLTQHPHLSAEETSECRYDPGGYFIINGSEKTVIMQERAAENKIYCYPSAGSTKSSFQAEIKSVPDYKRISPKQVVMQFVKGPIGHTVQVTLPRVRKAVPLFVLFRALGVISDKDICTTIMPDGKHWDDLIPSITDAVGHYTQEECMLYISSNSMYSISSTTKTEKPSATHQRRRDFSRDVLENDLFPHCHTKEQRVALLGYMAKRLVQCGNGREKCDDRDDYVNKRVDSTGVMLNNLYRNFLNKMIKDAQKLLIREMNTGSWRSTNDPRNILTATNVYKIIKMATIERGLKSALSTGDFSLKQNVARAGVAQVLNRLTYAATLSHLRRLNTPVDRNGKMVQPRKLHNSQWGLVCPAETPEGQSIGVVKNMSYMAHVTTASSSASIYEFAAPFIVEHADPAFSWADTKVVINGVWMGNTVKPHELYDDLKNKKYMGMINIYASVVFDYAANEIRVCNDAGRLVRPVFRVVDGAVRDVGTRETFTWEELLVTRDRVESLIEYIDSDEQNAAMIAMRQKQLTPGCTFTHCEIHPSVIFGVLASCIPFPEHNQSPRNTYQCAMGKQAVGVYVTNFHERLDKTAYVLTYPHRPLVDTRAMDMMKLNKIPSGMTITVAIMSYTGYNQEDSVIVNQAFLDRGGFQTTLFFTEKDEDKKVHGLVEVRCKPDPAKTKGMKFGNYEKLGADGLVPENTLIENLDVIVGKVAELKRARNDHTQVIKFQDMSKCYRTDEKTFLNTNFSGVNGDGYQVVKTQFRVTREPVIGDKVSSRHGQKGTMGNIFPAADMPFMASGIQPDIMFNPHAIPSRMTIAQLKETLLGKVLVELGLFGDGTAFTELSIADISKELLKLGFEQNGEEILYNGMTGEQIPTTVFVGPCFYQRLKHMVDDKAHSRSTGPMVSLTRQPTEGRARDGGLRFGEMERDCTISHGAAAVTKERIYDASDKYKVHTCTRCGYIAAHNEGASIHLCNNCGNTVTFVGVELPYSCKLLTQELMTMGVTPRFITSLSGAS